MVNILISYTIFILNMSDIDEGEFMNTKKTSEFWGLGKRGLKVEI